MLDVLETAARAGGTVLTKYFKKTYYSSHKDTPRNIVTQADLESQKLITEIITKEMVKKNISSSEIGFIGEENLHSVKKHTFIIDPLDGTTNFSVGIPLFCIPIAYMQQDGQITHSVVFEPLTDSLYYAQQNHGAFKKIGSKKLKLECVAKPIHNVVVSAHVSASSDLAKQMLNLVSKLQPASLGVRHIGVVALEHCWFTENILGVAINSRSYIWDTAATQLIIEEAGGSLSNWAGNRLEYDFNKPNKQYNSIATHPKNLSTILKYL